MIYSNSLYIFLLMCIFAILFPSIQGHGWVDYPCQRGTLTRKVQSTKFCDYPGAPPDYLKHFPAGDKTPSPGAARRSQIRTGGTWVPFEPMKPDFKWRAGICGDLPTGTQAHMRGGKFYFNGKITAEYRQGDTMDITVSFVANHNGFFLFHVCDVAKCGGEISEDCFKQGHCYALKRAPNAACDSGNDLDCGPIDRSYPERWYIPCSKVPYDKNVHERKGGDKLQYLLPKDLTCEHCVLHWYWEGANDCNGPGIKEYYNGPDAPNWNQCRGQAGAIGGYSKSLKDCGGSIFPEEYYQCADIRINPSGSPVEASDTTSTSTETISTPTETSTTSTSTSTESTVPSDSTSQTTLDSGTLTAIAVVADDQVIVDSVEDGQEIDVSSYDKIALEAMKSDNNGPVRFYIDDEEVWTDQNGPFFLYGNYGRSPRYTKEPPLNKQFSFKISSSDGEIRKKMTLLK